tara:strand:- start:646 stop:918 length:273 start_codon:yes stop_codon:yes gene_type:complete
VRKTIYLLKLKCYYQNVNYNKIGRRLVSKNKNEIIMEKCFTEGSIKDLLNCERSMDKIMFEIGKKSKKEVEITIEEIIESLELGLSNDIY